VLTAQTILIVEDNAYLALDLATAVEEMSGRVAGPACSVADAMRILDSESVSAAILDCQLPDGDVTPVARRLVSQGIPYVIQTGAAVPAELVLLRSDAPLVMKPVNPKHVVSVLADHGRNRTLWELPARRADSMTLCGESLVRKNIQRLKAQLQAAQGIRRATMLLMLRDEQIHLQHLLARSE
jgi:DNA-binding response OmpR family regulator